MPSYREIVRSRVLPFYRFERKEGRQYTLLEKQHSLRTNTVPYNEIDMTATLAIDIPTDAINTSAMKDLFESIALHISELDAHLSRVWQLRCIKDVMIPRIEKYRSAVDKE